MRGMTQYGYCGGQIFNPSNGFLSVVSRTEDQVVIAYAENTGLRGVKRTRGVFTFDRRGVRRIYYG